MKTRRRSHCVSTQHAVSSWKDSSGYPRAAHLLTNADADGDLLTKIAPLDARAQKLLTGSGGKMKLSARGYHRVLRVSARMIADLVGVGRNRDKPYVAEKLSYRRLRVGTAVAA